MRAPAVLVASAVLLTSSSAAATLSPNRRGWFEGWWVPVGVTAAWSSSDELERGFALGGEASLVYWSEAPALWWWAGVYVDGLWDFGVEAARFSVGPEVGLGSLGLDAGYLVELGEGRARHGFTARLLGLFVFGGPYVRIGVFPGEPGDFVEVGLLAKFPLPTD